MSENPIDDATFAELLVRLREGAEAVEAEVLRVPADRWDQAMPGYESGWTRRQLLAHIAANDQRQITRVRVGAAIGTPADEEALARQGDTDGWNRQQVADRAGRSVDELLVEMHQRRGELIALLQRLTPAQRSQPMPFRATYRPLTEMVPMLLDHLAQHARALSA